MTENLGSAGIPRHIAVIMDGNGRWAKARGLSRSEGHRAGAETVRTLVKECSRLGVEYLTVYAFSKENWQRPKAEVGFLFDLFLKFIRNELPELDRRGIRLEFIGDRKDIPFAVRQALEFAAAKTADNQGMVFTLAISYSGREEILEAARSAMRSGLDPDMLTAEKLRTFMQAPQTPDPDLIIRTSGEMRLSNFLLWQCAYSELWFTPVLWPDFGVKELHEAIESYASRSRRYGLTEEQAEKKEG